MATVLIGLTRPSRGLSASRLALLRLLRPAAAAPARTFSGSAALSALAPKVQKFVDAATALCRPDNVHICTGSEEENQQLMDMLVQKGVVQKLSDSKRPGCYLALTDPADVARAESDTFICSKSKDDAGPTNNWVEPAGQREHLNSLFRDSMVGRTMYVMPFSMGPVGSPLAKIGVQVTDNPYVVANMRIMTRMGSAVLDVLGDNDFVRCMHSVGRPIHNPHDDVAWPCNIKKRTICHFPETEEIWSFGSAYGGNSLLGKKCFALRIASTQAQREGWLAEHMLILGITNPQGVKRYIAAAFPSACGKTNLSMLESTLPGWEIETVGDDIAWMRPGADGRLYAINPENGFFGVAPGTSMSSNPNAMRTIAKNTLFTNVGKTEDGDVYWEGMYSTGPPAGNITDWRGREHWKPTLISTFKGPGSGIDGSGYKYDDKHFPCAQPNSRFTTPIEQCPTLDSNWDAQQGVPIDAIIFGGRRNHTLPLVFESFNWQHGTFIGAIMRSSSTSASEVEGLANDPMAMRAFCGYNLKNYFAHWLKMGQTVPHMPKIFHVNWFRKDRKGHFIWPGFGENVRVLDWIFHRCDGSAEAEDTAIGRVPAAGAINTSGLSDVDSHTMHELLHVDHKLWRKEAAAARKYLLETLMHNDNVPVPPELVAELDALDSRLSQ